MSDQQRDLTGNIDAELEAELGDVDVDAMLNASADAMAQEQAEASSAATNDDEEAIDHQLIRGRISSISGDDVFVEITGVLGKNQGVVPLTQFDRPPRVGSIMDFVIERADDAEGITHLSREGAVSAATWDHLHVGSIVEARVTGTNKGGLELELVGGIRAFMPVSQIDIHHIDDMEPYVGEKLHARVQEINRRGKKVLLSRRAHLEEDRDRKRKKLWSELEVGQVREGVVSKLMEYGAFVDIGGEDGLVHISDMSYSRIDKPDEVVKQGDKVQVKVLKLDDKKHRISLGLKQVAPDPWGDIASRLQPGEQITGRVTRVVDFGAFLEVEPGVEGLIPLQELTWRRSERPGDVVSEGDMLHVQILQVDAQRHRIGLSLKQAQGDPWVGAEHKYARNTVVEGTVRSTTDYGAFVEIERGLEGLVHISELADQHVRAVEDVVKIGQTEKFRVIEIDEESRRMKLSLKQADRPIEDKPVIPAGGATFKSKKSKPGKPLKGGIE